MCLKYNILYYSMVLKLMLCYQNTHFINMSTWNTLNTPPPLINGNISPLNSSRVSTLTSPSANSRNDEVSYPKNPIHNKINYSDLSKLKQELLVVQVMQCTKKSTY